MKLHFWERVRGVHRFDFVTDDFGQLIVNHSSYQQTWVYLCTCFESD